MLNTCKSTCRSLVILIVLLFFVKGLFAQTGSHFTGIVIDKESGDPIRDARIEIVVQEEGNLHEIERLHTNHEGKFIINDSYPFPVKLVLTHPNYMRNEKVLEFFPDEEAQISLVRAQPVRISGTVIDQMTQEIIPHAMIEVIHDQEDIQLTRRIGTVTDENGRFELNFNYTVPFELRVSHISYQAKLLTVGTNQMSNRTIELTSAVHEGEDIVVVSDMIGRDEMRSTVTIDRVSSVDVQQLASFDAFDLVSTLREVDVATQSMNLQTVSTRGFNTGANARFMQLTDGVDSQAPGLGFPVGNLLGPPEVDISSMNLIVGPASTRYGSNAMNGVLKTVTRNPFVDPGFALTVKGAVNNLRLGGASQLAAEGEPMFDISGRLAHSFGERFAIKLTGSWIEGIDWKANNYDNIGYGEPWDTRDDVPGFDGVNIYGDESSVYLPIGLTSDQLLDGSLMPVTRTGYKEENLVDYDIATRKASGSLHFKITPEIEFMTEGRYGYTNTLYTADSRIRLQDFEIYQFKSEVQSEHFYLRGYTTSQKSGNSFDVFRLASSLLKSAKSDEIWYRDYRLTFERGVTALGIPSRSYAEARKFADSGRSLTPDADANDRYEPGTPEFEEAVERLRNTYDFEEGAGIRDNSILYNADGGFTVREVADLFDLEVGGNFRFYDIDSGGTIFPDTTGNHITNHQYGGFINLESELLNEQLNLNLALRADKNENFNPKLSPQIGFTYVGGEKHFFRLSYQYGFRYPTVREQFMNQNLGDSRILGGLKEITERYEFQRNAVTEQAIDRFNEAVREEMSDQTLVNTKAYNREQAELKNLHLLEQGIIAEDQLVDIKSEKTHSFEIGYRQLITPLLYLDLNYYVSFYEDFIGLTRLVKPRSSPSIDLYGAAGQVNNSTESDRFFVYSNARERVTIHGLSFDIKYQSGGFFAGLNGTYSELIQDSEDPVVPGFNTPPFKMNFEWGNREIAENVGFKMIYRYRTGHDWESPFLDGPIDGYGHFDFQFNVRIPQLRSMLKAGFTNMGVSQYYNVFGGPSIGSLVFATYTFNPGMF